MRVLGIETSCDDTGAAVYDAQRGLLAHRRYSQIELHARYGGVVPELAARDHVRKLLPLIGAVLREAGTPRTQAVAYTAGPGLAGALLVGAALGRGLAWSWGVPALGIHHMEGHLLAIGLEKAAPDFPFLGLLVSGGHTLLVEVRALGDYRVLGQTLDDAVGEAFDKAARALGLGYPGGPAIAQAARQGRAGRFVFPRPMMSHPGLDFSFSGLKTFTLNAVRAQPDDAQTRADLACAFQWAAVETLVGKTRRALEQTGLPAVVIAGGVAANTLLRERMAVMVREQGAAVFFPRPEFCTDNGAMIACAGYQRLRVGERAGPGLGVRPRWHLSELPPPGQQPSPSL